MACDNDLDGRGTLSEEALAAFTRFFLSVCIDRVNFMESLVQPGRLRARILVWAEEEIRLRMLPSKSGSILEAVLYRGELPRGDAGTVVVTGDRQPTAWSRHCSRGMCWYPKVRGPGAACLPGHAGIALDAGPVPGKVRVEPEWRISCLRQWLHSA